MTPEEIIAVHVGSMRARGVVLDLVEAGYLLASEAELAAALRKVPGLGYRMETGTCFFHKQEGCLQCRPMTAVDDADNQAARIFAALSGAAQEKGTTG